MKTIIFGNEVALISAIKTDDMVKIMRYEPNAMALHDDNNNPTFEFGIAREGCVAPFGIWFDDTTDEGYAIVKRPVYGENIDEKKKYIAETYGKAIMQVQAIETQLVTTLEKINNDMKAVVDDIKVVQLG